jgi:nucleotide-binding universal stress UspA family protein
MYSRILFPSDFGEHARQVLECTLEFRHVGLKEIVFLHVIDLDELGWYASPNYLKMREEQIRELAALQFQELEALVREHSVEASSIVETGIPSVEIASAAKSKRASLIIGGSHRKRGDQEEMLDTTTARVVRHASVPVLVTRFHQSWGNPEECARYCRQQFSKLLVPVDWSDCSMKAVDYAIGLKAEGPQEVIIAHVMDEHALQYSDAQQIEEFRKKDLERLEHTKTRLSLAGFNVKTHLHFGTPQKEIVRIAHEERVSLIVMGHHGKGWMKNLAFGSTTERVLRQSDVSVLVVNDMPE